jgi:uncharacterized protein (DUF433 family)
MRPVARVPWPVKNEASAENDCVESAMTTERIAIDPAIMMGQPVIRGTRITVELILHKLAEGATEADLLEDYPHLTTEDLPAAAVPHPVGTAINPCKVLKRKSCGEKSLQ